MSNLEHLIENTIYYIKDNKGQVDYDDDEMNCYVPINQ